MPRNINLEDEQQNKIIEIETDIGQLVKGLKKILELAQSHSNFTATPHLRTSPSHSGTKCFARRKKLNRQ